MLEATCHASCDRHLDWEQSCAKVMGFAQDSLPQTQADHHTQVQAPVMNILNLMDDTPAADNDVPMTDAQEYPSNTQDHWMDNANQIDASITQMANMISKNQRAYVTRDLDDEEASVLESTVLSFSATAANQVDSLRAAIDPQHHSSDYVHYCSGIVAALLLRLGDQVANPMALLQKQRTRTAMAIYRQPLACRYVVKETSMNTQRGGVWDQLVEDDEDDATTQRFQPQHAAPSMSTDFMAIYATNGTDDSEVIASKPVSLFQKRPASTTTNDVDSIQEPPAKHVKFASFNKTKKIQEERLLYHEQQEQVHFQEDAQQEMQKEAVLLEASLQNDLDSVYQEVEQSMTQISKLLSQFSALVSEQQEEIITIHDTTLTSKENVSKGQESLIDAKERTKRSKHYMATLVWSVAMILLFFNYVTP